MTGSSAPLRGLGAMSRYLDSTSAGRGTKKRSRAGAPYERGKIESAEPRTLLSQRRPFTVVRSLHQLEAVLAAPQRFARAAARHRRRPLASLLADPCRV